MDAEKNAREESRWNAYVCKVKGTTVECGCPDCVKRTPCTVLKVARRWHNWLVRCDECGREFRRCEQVHPERRLSDEERRRRKNARNSEYQRERAKDPDWRAKRRERDRERYAAMDPEKKAEYLARHRERTRRYRTEHPEKWAYLPVSELTPDELAHRRNVEAAKHRRYAAEHPGYNAERCKGYRERHPEHREKARAAYRDTMAFLEKRPAALERFRAEKREYDREYRRKRKEAG